jgi:hypothetical protein
MKARVAQISIHLVASIAFLAIPVLTSPDLYRLRELIHIYLFIRDFLFYFFTLGFFYANYYLLIPKLYFLRKFWWYAFALTGLFLLVLILPMALLPSENFQPPPGMRADNAVVHMHSPPVVREIFNRLFIFLVVAFFSLVIRINGKWRQVQQEKKDSELSYLKAQINPHFLFNTLNSIYSLAITKSDETAKSIVKLSGMMRYVTSEASADLVPLEKEISYISDYVDLQRIRLRNTVELEFEVRGSPGRNTIVPLLLIPFVENAFKHGVNPEEDSHIIIRIEMGDSDVQMMVKNNKVSERLTDKTGIGVETTVNRLKLSYPGRHGLRIDNNEKHYCVTLNIRLK